MFMIVTNQAEVVARFGTLKGARARLATLRKQRGLRWYGKDALQCYFREIIFSIVEG